MPGVLKRTGQLRRRGRFTGTLQAHEQDGRRRPSRNRQRTMFAPHQDAQFIADNLDHLLSWGQTAHHLLPHGLLTHTLHEILDHLEIDIRLK